MVHFKWLALNYNNNNGNDDPFEKRGKRKKRVIFQKINNGCLV